VSFKKYDTPEDVAAGFTEYLHALLQKSNKNQFHIALSGGSTPKTVFNYIVNHYKTKIQWSKVHLWWGDERMVPSNNSESNYKMTKDNLLSFIDIPEKNIHRIHGEAEPVDEAIRYSTEIKEHITIKNGLPSFDLIILGMGEDGHTASIFPHQMELLNSTNTCEIAQHPVSKQKRITLTGRIINNAEIVALLITGENKSEKIATIFTNSENAALYPASHIKPSGTLCWFLDKSALTRYND
jgi:6-phosphogluconolactonase